ncbi:hypothetical protein H8356DRAFT_1342824 [Neocallimastix lanati (nom. inval.)]|nr:hypothetical protein H8356DRAFT_1342812 [Neocallimastix sp. JGI-2020a]KAG4082738.1 hypothetical protein H8356DRAFT_1342824 [Neocallimastix sp. JGI-2020a]
MKELDITTDRYKNNKNNFTPLKNFDIKNWIFNSNVNNEDFFIDTIKIGMNIRKTIVNEINNTGFFKTIILNNAFSLTVKKDYFDIYIKLLIIVMNMKSKYDEINLEIDNNYNNVHENSLEYAMEHNLYEFVNLLLRKGFRNNYREFNKAVVYK